MLFSQDIGIDLGTANTLVCVKGKGIVIREPSVVALDVRMTPPKVVAVGDEAKKMIGRTPGSITAVRPLKDGVIADFNITSDFLRALVRKAMAGSPLARVRVMITIPSSVTEVERKAVHDAAKSAGARYVSLIEEPMAAAIGAGLPVAEATGSMIVDIGGGTCEVAVVSLGDIVTSRSIRMAGDKFDDAIIAYVRRKYNLLIGERTAEELKISIGSAYPYPNEGKATVRGRNLLDGLPKNVEVTAEDIRDALEDPLTQIVETVRTTLEKTPPELASDIVDRGIILTGGGALLRGLDRLIAQEVGITVKIAKNPLDCVVAGTAICLEKDSLNINGKRNG
ncbi:MAG: rod shape-determining protein [Clostridia bacterium]|nr:rod shape-determining protein [Clostridia bacterium]MBR6781256.1 rod shape-determining protein [Clostridia bacterium]